MVVTITARRASRLIVLVLMSLTLGACDPAPPTHFGLRLVDHSVEVSVLPCDERFSITEVTLYSVRGARFSPAAEDVLWKIETSGTLSEAAKDVILGQAPPGFREIVPLRGGLPADSKLGIDLGGGSPRYEASFTLSQLSSNEYLVGRKVVKEDQIASSSLCD
jgi:hypothetical protein